MNVPVLRGERCVLQEVGVSDAEAWLAGEDAEQRRWFDMTTGADIVDVRRAIAEWRAQWARPHGMRHWGIRVNGVLAGGIELRQRDRTDDDAGWLNLSYVVWPQFRRRGIGLDAVRLVTGWAWDNLPADVVKGIAHVENTASRRLLLAAGFRDDGPATAREAGEGGPMLRHVLTRPGPAVNWSGGSG